MNANLKNKLPQEGTGNTGESLPESNSGSPSYSGGGTTLRSDGYGINPMNKPKLPNMVQQTFHRSMFERTRSNSLSALNKEQEPTLFLTTTKDLEHSTWQSDQVPLIKRKRNESHSDLKENSNKLQKTTYSIPTHNQFETLEILDEDGSDPKPKIPKPEPIFVTGVAYIKTLKDILNKITNDDPMTYTMTTLRSGHVVKILPRDIEMYKKIRDNFITNNISHYTYKLKSERAYRVVLRGLHSTEDTEVIKSELRDLGHEVRNIVNVRHKTTKQDLPLFYIDLEPKHNNKEVFKVNRLNNMKVSFEAPYKTTEILQCKRCQRFGHSKNQCYRPHRCVKCGGDHPTVSCKKTPDTEATCVNCQEKHPASYKGCIKYKQYKQQILKINPKNVIKDTPASQPNKEKPRKAEYTKNIFKTYADAVNSNNNKQQTESHLIDSSELNKLIDSMFNKFQTIMTNMIDSMMNRMIQLISRLVPK